MHRTVLAVDRNQLRTWGLPCSLDHRPGGDQRFLVGQAETLARLEGCEGDGQPGEADNPVDDGVGGECRFGHRRIAHQQVDALGQLRPDLGRCLGISNCDDLGAKLLCLGDDVGVATDTERRHDIVAGALANDLECLRADRAGRTQHRHRGGHRRLS